MLYLNIASIRMCTEAEGPGKRFALWVQGCNKRCKGCCNPEMQIIERKHVVSVDDIKKLIIQSSKENNIEGISLIGGEPVLQAKGLAELAFWCTENNFSVLVFTGYTYSDLLKMNDESVNALLENTDVLVDGEFIKGEYDDERDWVGSRNQKVIYLSERYDNSIENDKETRQVEILVSDNTLRVNGWPFDNE